MNYICAIEKKRPNIECSLSPLAKLYSVAITIRRVRPEAGSTKVTDRFHVGQPSHSSAPCSGYKERLVEFSKFEHEFEKCISKTAVQTKFEQHTNRGKEIITLLTETTASISLKSQTCKQDCVQKLTDMDQKNNFIERELRAMTESAKDKIRHVSEDVYKRVAQTLNDEIKR